MQQLARNSEFDMDAVAVRVKGWGADLEQRPGVPREKNRDTTITGFNDPIRTWQKPRAEILLTNERDRLPPVFTNARAPKGLSGVIRRIAFRYSENTMRHWLMLMGADRIDMVEGWFEDLAAGKKPMILPRQEYRTLDHLRRIRDQGVKNNQDVALLAATGLVAVGAVAGVIWLAKKAMDQKSA